METTLTQYDRAPRAQIHNERSRHHSTAEKQLLQKETEERSIEYQVRHRYTNRRTTLSAPKKGAPTATHTKRTRYSAKINLSNTEECVKQYYETTHILKNTRKYCSKSIPNRLPPNHSRNKVWRHGIHLHSRFVAKVQSIQNPPFSLI
eukprot:1066711-Rhodomonas_salina.1